MKLPLPLLLLFSQVPSVRSSFLAFWYILPVIYPASHTPAAMGRFPYWVLPIIAGVSWSAMLATFMIYWQTTGRTHYSSMDESQTIAYISDVGAYRLKALFITGAAVTTVCIDISLLSERWLRHRGHLTHNFTKAEKGLSISSIVFGVLGGLGLLLLSIFDTNNYATMHNIFLFVFMGGYIASATCSCWEYQSLGSRGREYCILRVSFWIKLVFILLQGALAITFVATLFTSLYNTAAVLEWTLAFIFGIFLFSYAIDLFPAARNGDSKPKIDIERK